MGNTLKRWDYAWRILCAPEAPWFDSVITKLLGCRYEGWDFELSDGESGEPHAGDGEYFSDPLFVIFKDEQSKRIHFEFQAYDCNDIARRVLAYWFASTYYTQRRRDVESVMLPDAYIVNVRGYARAPKRERVLELHVNRRMVQILYPVVEGHEALGIADWIDTDDMQQREAGAYALCRDLYTGDVGSLWSEKLCVACSLLYAPQAFESGVEEQEVIDMARKMQYDMRNRGDALREWGVGRMKLGGGR